VGTAAGVEAAEGAGRITMAVVGIQGLPMLQGEVRRREECGKGGVCVCGFAWLVGEVAGREGEGGGGEIDGASPLD
jgi:hypothetical protein